MKTFTEDPFEFRKARIVGGDEGAEVGVVGGLSGLDGTGNLFSDEGRGITSAFIFNYYLVKHMKIVYTSHKFTFYLTFFFCGLISAIRARELNMLITRHP